jgi:uncharacterized protein YndB with AHSA1/START domain
MSTERRLETEVVVPATPEQAWEAIATGPGITAWFMPAEVEGRVGGAVIHHYGPDESSSGTLTAYSPPDRFAYEEEFALGEGEPPHPIATEFLVEARSGGTCIVRVVMSGFGDGEDWDHAINSFASGWRQALLALRLYLTHFQGERVGSINASDTVQGDKDEIWVEFTRALGLPTAPQAGDRVATSAGDAPLVAGTVEEVEGPMVTLLLDQPARGIGFIGAGGPGDEVFTIVRAQLFGADAAEIGAREQAAWTSWFSARQAPSTSSRS